MFTVMSGQWPNRGFSVTHGHNSQPEVVTFDLIPDRDLVVEPMSTTSSTQPSRPYIRSSPSASSEDVTARNSGSSSSSAAPPPAAPQAGAANPLRFDARTIHFSVNAWVLLVVGLGMLPILPKHLEDRACKLSLLGIILSSGYSLYSTYGVAAQLPETFMYWNVLMMMYRTPVTSSYHQSAWAKIGRTVNLYINRFRGIL
ncbi:hypothetical protein D1007_11579 [Hordeum vulgare]|nr:hypothetical protein D1007_11579 [Hordeum vulgare]